MKKLFLSFILLFTFSALTINAQDRAPSPASKIEQKVGLTDITIEYSRPGKKDRSIFADNGLVPFGKVWRTGANAATKITFSDDVKIADKDLAAGSYAILSVPTATSWEIQFHPYSASRWMSYSGNEPTLSVMAQPQNIDVAVESFMIGIQDLRDYSATLFFAWENTLVSVPITVK